MEIRIYNSLSRKLETFKPLTEGQVLMYTCGPTVYQHVTVANFRTYVLADIIYRVLSLNDYRVKHIMNLTDVGHLTGDNTGDPDAGDDKLEAAAENEGKSAREIADFYIKHFQQDFDILNLKKPHKFTRATEYIQEQIELVKVLERKGYAYRTSDGVYFDTMKFKEYGKLSGLSAESIKEGARVAPNPEKKSPSDFALWKFSKLDERRWQEWESPWGLGFPGWHLECSAMSMKELGNTLDIHVGGEDLRMIHHQNEIAQSECATGEKFVNYWIHGAFLQVDGGRMGKSLGNAYTVSDVESKGFNSLSLKYFYMTAHYRSPLNFTWGALQSADSALKKLYTMVSGYTDSGEAEVSEKYLDRFTSAVNDDFNMPKALAIIWELLKSSLGEGEKLVTVLKFDQVLGLDVEKHVGLRIPKKVTDLAETRKQYRINNIWDKADLIRREIEQEGYIIEDIGDGYKVKKKL